MTAPVETPASIEHLSFEPSCDECEHTAQFWLDIHGCEEHLLCTTCAEADRREFDQIAAKDGRTRCGTCRESFARYEDATTVRPL